MDTLNYRYFVKYLEAFLSNFSGQDYDEYILSDFYERRFHKNFNWGGPSKNRRKIKLTN